MKIKWSLFVILLSIVAYSQNKNIEIDYTFTKIISKKDSTRISKSYKLLIDDDSSLYLSNEKIEEDSISKLNRNSNLNIRTKSVFIPNEVIEFKKKPQKITTFKEIMETPIAYTESALSNWKLLDKTKMITGDILLNSAEIDFAGRKWIAWYNKNYPLNEGP